MQHLEGGAKRLKQLMQAAFLTCLRSSCSSRAWERPLLMYFTRFSSAFPTGTRRLLQYLNENASRVLPTSPGRRAST